MHIRREQPADFDAIDDIVRTAFRVDAARGVDHGTQCVDLVRAIRQDGCYRPTMALVAVDGDAVVGHVMVDGCWVRRAAGDRPIVMLSPLAVAPGYQRRGIGTALIAAAMTAADAAGEPLVVLEGSPNYYGARGFEPASAHGLTLPLPDWAPPAAAQVRLLTSYRGDDASLHGQVVYPPPFDGLD